MLVKLQDGLYVNPDQVVSMTGGEKSCRVTTTEIVYTFDSDSMQRTTRSKTHELERNVEEVAELLNGRPERSKSHTGRTT